MHSLIKSLVIVVAFATSTAFASDGEVVIRTRDGKSRQGRVLSETKNGYLLAMPKGTSVIAFGDIVDMKQVEIAPALAAPIEAATPVVAAPTPPPPPPMPSAQEGVVAAAPLPEKVNREGFHFGLGANVGVRSGGPIAQAQAHLDFNFGRPAYRISVNFSSPAAEFFVAHIDNFFHWNVGDYFALGAGIQVGLAWGGGYNFLYVAPVIQPAIVKLGDRGQHQLSVTASIAALSTYHYGFRGSYDGTLQVFGGYSYLF